VDGKGGERFETVVIGGGQAGLATAYHLRRRGVPAVVLDGGERIGDAWRTRWDSLRLFTPARYDGLPGWRFPAPDWSFPTKDEVADYMEAYVERFGLSVRTNVVVDRLSREHGRYVVSAGDRTFEADRVVVATGANRIPRVPAFAPLLAPAIPQMHSSEYRSPAQLPDGDVLVVGVGNSGAEIAFELSRTRHVVLAGKETGQIPVRHSSGSARLVFPIVRFLGLHVLTVRTPIGRRVRRKGAGAPLIRVRGPELAAAGVERVPRIVGVQSGLPETEDGRALEVAAVIWCTGFRTDFSWIDLPAFDERGEPIHARGVASNEPGLYFVGLTFQYAQGSEVLPGVGRDAAFVAKAIAAARARAGSASTSLIPAAAPPRPERLAEAPPA
jgi:putative flavoprotein involved in K+ transport